VQLVGFITKKILNLHENYWGFKAESTLKSPPLCLYTLAGRHSFVIDVYLPLYIFAEFLLDNVLYGWNV